MNDSVNMVRAIDDEKLVVKAQIIEWIKHILTRKGWTGTELARKADLSPSTITRLMNSKNYTFVSSLKTLRAISDTSGYPLPAEIMEAMDINHEAVRPHVESMEDVERTVAPKSIQKDDRIVMRHISNLPRAIQAHHKDEMIERPVAMKGDETAFAFVINDNAMEPLVPSGALLYATKRREPREGDLVLVGRKNGQYLLRMLLDMDEKGFHLKSYLDDSKNRIIPFDEVVEMPIVIGVFRD